MCKGSLACLRVTEAVACPWRGWETRIGEVGERCREVRPDHTREKTVVRAVLAIVKVPWECRHQHPRGAWVTCGHHKVS